jgi:hypothetical protein
MKYGYVDNNRRTALMAQTSERYYFRPGSGPVDINLKEINIPLMAYGEAPAAQSAGGNGAVATALIGLVGTIATPIIQKWLNKPQNQPVVAAPQTVSITAPPAPGPNYLLWGLGAGALILTVVAIKD